MNKTKKLMKNIMSIFLVSCLVFGQLTCFADFGPDSFSSSTFSFPHYYGNSYLVATLVPDQAAPPRHSNSEVSYSFKYISNTKLSIDGGLKTLAKNSGSDSPYRVYPIKISEQLTPTYTFTKLVGNAIKIGDKYYVARDDIYDTKDGNLNDFIDAFNGNRAYVKNPANGLKLFTVSEREDIFEYRVRAWEGDVHHGYYIYYDDSITKANTMEHPMYLYELKNIVQLCGASMADNTGSNGYIDVTVTEAPEITIETSSDSQNYVIIDPDTKEAKTKIDIKVQTFNKYNNDSMNITFLRPAGIGVGVSESVYGYFDKAVPTVYTGTPNSNGVLTYSDKLTLAITKSGMYSCKVLAIDGVGRSSNYLPPSLMPDTNSTEPIPIDSSYYYFPSVTIMAHNYIKIPSMDNIRGTIDVTSTPLEQLDENSEKNKGINPEDATSYGIKGYYQPKYPADTFKIIAPAGEAMLFQCKFGTHSEGRCSDAPDMNYVHYSIKFKIKSAGGGYDYKVVEGEMENVEKLYTYSTACCPCKEGCCGSYISSKNFTYRKILAGATGDVVDGEYEIRIDARASRWRFNSDNASLTAGTSGQSARIITVYTPLRQSYKQTWYKDLTKKK